MCQLMETLQITIRACDDKVAELLRTCQLIADQTLQESGCESSLLSQNKADEGLINFEQKWKDRPSLINYFRSDYFTALLGAMKWLGRSYDILLNGGTHEEGIEIVKSARRA